VTRLAVFTVVAAAVVFCAVQDRVTASGAERYVTVQRDALAGKGPAVTIDDVMRPAVTRSVRQGLAWGGAAGAVAFAGGTLVRRRRRRE
jgi:hypothetical protein